MNFHDRIYITDCSWFDIYYNEIHMPLHEVTRTYYKEYINECQNYTVTLKPSSLILVLIVLAACIALKCYSRRIK